MPPHGERSIMGTGHGPMYTIETRNTENMFGLWSGKPHPESRLDASGSRELTIPCSLYTMLSSH
jgi:hypothetical protein